VGSGRCEPASRVALDGVPPRGWLLDRVSKGRVIYAYAVAASLDELVAIPPGVEVANDLRPRLIQERLRVDLQVRNREAVRAVYAEHAKTTREVILALHGAAGEAAP
jgi:hypothetical protein